MLRTAPVVVMNNPPIERRPMRGVWLPSADAIAPLQRVTVGLAGADAHCALDAGDKDLAVADLAGLGRVGDHLDHLVDLVVVDSDVDPDLGQEVHGVFGAAINLLVALLAAVAFDLGDGHALDAVGGERVAHVVELERLDDGDDQFHGISVPRYAAPIEPRVRPSTQPGRAM